MIHRVRGHGFGAGFDGIAHVIPAEAELGVVVAATCGESANWLDRFLSAEDGTRICGDCAGANGLPYHDETRTFLGEATEEPVRVHGPQPTASRRAVEWPDPEPGP